MWKTYQHGGDIYNYPNFIDFSANINFLGAPFSVLDAARNAMERIGHYPQVGWGNLRQAIAELEQIEPEQIICANGAAEIFFSLTLAKKPKKALIFAPTFQEYEQALRSVDCEIVYHYLCAADKFEMQELPPELDHSIDMVFFCNPNNPTGVLTRRSMLKRLLQRCEQVGAVLVIDECFLDFTGRAEDYTMKDLLSQSGNLFVVKAFTKTFAIPGLRLGYGLSGNYDLLQQIRSVTQPWNVSVPAQAAGIAAAREKDFLEITARAVEQERQFFLEQLSKVPSDENKLFFIEVYGYAANFIFFRSIPGLEQKFKENKILIRNCDNFPGLCEGWYRIAVRARQENERFVQVLYQIIQEIENKTDNCEI